MFAVLEREGGLVCCLRKARGASCLAVLREASYPPPEEGGTEPYPPPFGRGAGVRAQSSRKRPTAWKTRQLQLGIILTACVAALLAWGHGSQARQARHGGRRRAAGADQRLLRELS